MDPRSQESLATLFYQTGLDAGTPYAVTNLTIRRDAVTLLFKDGVLYLLKPIDGEVTGAVFIGDGRIGYTPPNRTERAVLRRHAGADVLAEPFTEAVLRFTDGSAEGLVKGARPLPGGASGTERAAAILAERNSWLDSARDILGDPAAPEMRWLEARGSSLRGLGVFLADVHTGRFDWLSYLNDPQRVVENVLFTRASLGSKGKAVQIAWSEWHNAPEYSSEGYYQMNPERDGPRLLRVLHNDMTLNLPNTNVVEWEARMNVEALVEGLQVLRFDLANNMDYGGLWTGDTFYPVHLASVTGEGGSPVRFLHRKDQLLVFLDRPLTAGARIPLTFKGTAQVIYQLTAESFGLLEGPWYPQYGYNGGRSTFHWTVRVPQPYEITGSGKVVQRYQDKEAGQNVLEAESDIPVFFPWMIFGRFQMAETRFEPGGNRAPIKMTLHSFPSMTIPINDQKVLDLYGYAQPTTIQLHAPIKKVDAILDESKEILKLYEKIYSPYPYEELHIAQMAPQLGFGQSPAWFVQLTGAAFLSAAKTESDFLHGFLAHEIAHQWWGHQIGWATDDDVWLSESFAEYSSGIYVKELQGAKRFQRTLQEWKRDAKYSDAVAPIAAAQHATDEKEGGRHRYNLLYAKGPYVLHMLRVMLDDEKYVAVMRSLQENFRNRSVSTEMLIREVSRVTKTDYAWFFDQWFYDTGIPTFRYTWKADRQPDGKYLVTVHVSQADKKNVKRVLMPVFMEFRSAKQPVVQFKDVSGAEQDLKFLAPEAPKDVSLDDENTLLAEIVHAG